MGIKKRVFDIFKNESVLVGFLLAAGLLIRLFFALTDHSGLGGDEGGYDKLAMNITQYHEFGMSKGQPTAFGMPFYPIFLSVIYSIFGHNFMSARVGQAVLGVLVCFVIYLIARDAFGKSIALLSLFFMSIHYFFIGSGLLINSENLFILFVAVSILFLVKLCGKPAYLYAGLFGVFCAFATLTRSAYFLFPFMVIACFFVFRGLINITAKRKLKISLIIVVCAVAPISIWAMRNYFVFKAFIPLATESGIVFYSAYNPNGKVLDSSAIDAVTLKYFKMPEIEGNRFLLRETFLSIKREPAKLYKYIPLKVMYFFSVFDWLAFKADGVYNFSTAFILPLAIFGIIFSFRKKDSYTPLIILLPVLYFLVITIVIWGVPRTRLPIEPYLIIFAAFFTAYIYNACRHKLQVAGWLFIWYMLNFVFYLNSGYCKAAARSLFKKIGLW